MIDATANLPARILLNFSGGYLYSNTDPYVLYDQRQHHLPHTGPARRLFHAKA